MSDLTRAPSPSLLGRTRDLATMSEPELRRLAAEALWALAAYGLGRVLRHVLAYFGSSV